MTSGRDRNKEAVARDGKVAAEAKGETPPHHPAYASSANRLAARAPSRPNMKTAKSRPAKGFADSR